MFASIARCMSFACSALRCTEYAIASACFGGLCPSVISVLMFSLRALSLLPLIKGMTDSPVKKRVRAAKDMSCVVCGTIVTKVPFYRQATFKCCSRSCTARYAAHIDQRVKQCQVCNAEFTVSGARRDSAKYCSNACKGKALQGRGSLRHDCKHCHAEFYDAPGGH